MVGRVGRAYAVWKSDPVVDFALLPLPGHRQLRVRGDLRTLVLNVLFVATALVVVIASH